MGKRINKDFDFEDILRGAKETPKGEYITVCPLCKRKKEAETPGRIYDKKKLYIDPGMSKGFCHVCETTFFNKNKVAAIKKIEILEPLKFENGIEHISMPYLRSDPKNAISHEYLVKRCPQLYKDVDLSSLGFCCSNDKIVIKFNLNGDNYYYQLRYMYPERDNNGDRYYSPPVDGNIGKPLYFAGGSYNPFLNTVLVEGVFTALTEKLLLGDNYNVVAVLGHYLTNYQQRMLKRLGVYGTIYIHMDETVMSWNVRKQIKDIFPMCRVIRNWSEELDSEEIIRNGRLTTDAYRDYLIRSMKGNGENFVLKQKKIKPKPALGWLDNLPQLRG